MDWGRKIQAVRPFISIHDLHVVFKTRHAGYPVRQGSTQCQRIRLLQWFLEGKIWCWGTQEVRGTYEWWRKGQRREGWGQRRRKQVHSTNVGRQGQSGQHLLLESPRPASLSPRPPCFFVPLHPPLKLSLIPLVFVFFFYFLEELPPEDLDISEPWPARIQLFFDSPGSVRTAVFIAQSYKDVNVIIVKAWEII